MAMIPGQAWPTALPAGEVPAEHLIPRNSSAGKDQKRGRTLCAGPASRSSAVAPARLDPVAGRSWAARCSANDETITVVREHHESSCSEGSRGFQAVLDEFTKLWEQEEISRAEDYFARIGPVAPRLAVEVIYREFCLAELSGLEPDPRLFLARFPEYRQRLERLFSVHRHFSASQLQRWVEPEPDADNFPQPGDDIGPYLLFRELGRGGFARVYLAGQADLENRLVVVKLSTRSTREPWLLARVRHAHVVEILSHAVVDDGAFQLICMPFMGGATLSAVLHHRRQVPCARPLPGELLRVLDLVSAPEYGGASTKRPAREILAALPDSQAFAWITARLADALDHAFCRGVAHGDVKPSNILMTADGNPMLLDFNLAQDWSLAADGRPLEDVGGTLAYMAPERLRAIVSGRASQPELLDAAVGRDESSAEDRFEPHRADIYSLGMVLLEAIAGAAPLSALGDETGPTWAGKGLCEWAALHASFREQGAAAVIGAAVSRSGKSVPAALRAILERCLAPRSNDRYRRALELAEDLDRWRTDRPLAYASEPFWAQTVPRWVRTRRRLLWTVGLAVTVSIVTMSLALVQTRTTLQNLAIMKLARNWDDIESGAFQYQRPGWPRLQDPDSPDNLATAVRAIKEYGVLDSEDWRQREDVRNLPAQDLEDLEFWLMEQVYRYARALGDRPGSRVDWARAIAALDHLATTPPLQAAEALRRRVHDRMTGADARDARAEISSTISTAAARAPLSASPRPAPLPGLDEYLQGLAAELEDISEPRIEPQSDAPLPVLQNAQRALEHYDQLLARNPGSFWGHYRAAVVCFRMRQWSLAAGHLDCCLHRRSKNSSVRGQYAACLGELGLLDSAIVECSQALSAAPDYAEFYRSRAFLRAQGGRTQGLEEDLKRFEMLSRSLTKGFFRDPPGQNASEPRSSTVPFTQRALDLDREPVFMARHGDPLDEPEEVPREEIEARAELAIAISKAGAQSLLDGPAASLAPTGSTGPPETPGCSPALDIATVELGKVLKLDPEHIGARMTRMAQSLAQGHFDQARNDLELVLEDPKLADLRKTPKTFAFLHGEARRFARYGLIDEALKIADKTLELSDEDKSIHGRSHYFKAVVLGYAARSDRTQIAAAAQQLQLAFQTSPRFKQWYKRDPAFDPVRIGIDAALQQLPEVTYTQ